MNQASQTHSYKWTRWNVLQLSTQCCNHWVVACCRVVHIKEAEVWNWTISRRGLYWWAVYYNGCVVCLGFPEFHLLSLLGWRFIGRNHVMAGDIFVVFALHTACSPKYVQESPPSPRKIELLGMFRAAQYLIYKVFWIWSVRCSRILFHTLTLKSCLI